MTGGYQILDLGYKELTKSVGMLYGGIYDILEGSNKAILLEGVNIEGKEYRPQFVIPQVVGSSFTIPFHGMTITITDTDVVTVTGGIGG